jgi:hypothetical protein
MVWKYLYLEATGETKLSKMSVTRKNLAGKGHVDGVEIFITGGHKGDESFQDVRYQEEFGGKSVTWMSCKYLYLVATWETKLSKIFVARKNLAGKGHVGEV